MLKTKKLKLAQTNHGRNTIRSSEKLKVYDIASAP